MTLDQALSEVAALRRQLLDATRSKPAAEQQAVCDGEIGTGYRRAVDRAQRAYYEQCPWTQPGRFRQPEG